MSFQKADKKQGRLRIALTAPSGGGKTFSGLLIAQGIIEGMKKLGLDTGKGIAVIDTENGSALDYADRFEFDHMKIEPPYTVPKYIAGMQEAYDGGYAVLIVDSLSHAWAGEGGLLQKKEAIDARGGNSYTNWATITKEHEQLKSIILSNKIHLIAMMRSKQDYVIEQNEKGKSAPRKVGLAPVQREGMEYEFTVVFDLGMDHNAHVSKDRTAMFDGEIFKPTKKTGTQLLEWRMSGKPETPEPVAPAPAVAQNSSKPATAAPPVNKSGIFKPSAVTSYDSPRKPGTKVFQLVLVDGKEGGAAMVVKTDNAAIAADAEAAMKGGADVRVEWRVMGEGNDKAAIVQTLTVMDAAVAE